MGARACAAISGGKGKLKKACQKCARAECGEKKRDD